MYFSFITFFTVSDRIKTANQIHNLVRGLNPIMGAYTFLNSKKLKIWKTKVITEKELIEKFPELEEYLFKLNLSFLFHL